MSFQAYVDAIARTEIEFPHLRAAMLAQSIMESGRESTRLSQEFNNHLGMKFRPEMEGYATPVYYETSSEPTGGANFCSFDSKTSCVKGYWHFLTRFPYAGWRAHTRDAIDFLRYICPIWCPSGYTDVWQTQHGGLSYHEYVVQKLLPEANMLLEDAYQKIDAEKITKLVFNRKDNGQAVVTAYANDEPKYTHIAEDPSWPSMKKWIDQFPNVSLVSIEDTTKSFPKLPDFGEKEVPPQKAKPEWLPFALRAKSQMKTVEKRWPKYLVIHWTAGDPNQNGEDGIDYGARNGYTYLFMDRAGVIYQSVPLNSAGYHVGSANASSLDCLGIEVACAGRVQKIGDLYVPWFAKNNTTGEIDEKRCIPQDQVIEDQDGPDDDGSYAGFYQLYSEAQRASLERLALFCCEELGIAVENVKGHDEIALPLGRKTDPGLSIGPDGMVGFRKKISALLEERANKRLVDEKWA